MSTKIFVPSCWRQRNNWLVWIPAALATSEAPRPAPSPQQQSAPSPPATNFGVVAPR